MDLDNLRYLLDKKVEEFERVDFIENDPIQIPHSFNKLQDIEIAGFFASILAWGNRRSIIKSCRDLLMRMENAPYDFILNARVQDLQALDRFVYRTFNEVDVKYFVTYLQHHYRIHNSLEDAFLINNHFDAYHSINAFHHHFFSLPNAPIRTRKHVSLPSKNSAAKRINMYLRWMVRTASEVDFGLWNRIQPKDLMLPLDVHTSTVSRRLEILQRQTNDWKAVVEVTEVLRHLDMNDPIKYDFALFGMGVSKEYY